MLILQLFFCIVTAVFFYCFFFCEFCCDWVFRVVQIFAYILYTLTSLNIDWFSNLFHCHNQASICNNTVTKDTVTPQVYCYTTLWNVSVLKATVENNTNSGTTHLKKSKTRNNVLIAWVIVCQILQFLPSIISVSALLLHSFDVLLHVRSRLVLLHIFSCDSDSEISLKFGQY